MGSIAITYISDIENSCLSFGIIGVKVVFRKTVGGDYLSGSHLQSQVKYYVVQLTIEKECCTTYVFETPVESFTY